MQTKNSAEQQAKRLKNWISMLLIFPPDSSAGLLRDSFWQEALEAELRAIECRLRINRAEKSANSLLSLINNLNALRRVL